MALRSLGHTLLAKAGSGTALRSATETKQQGAVQAASTSAQPNSVQRGSIDQPLEKATPSGTEKIIATAPSIQGRVSLDSPGGAATQPAPTAAQGLLPEMGGAATAARSGVPVSKLNATGAPMGAPVGAVAPKTEVGATPVSQGTNLRTTIAKTFGDFLTPTQVTEYAKQPTTPSSSSQVAVNQPKPSGVNPVFGWLTGTGSRVSAANDTPNPTFNQNFLQGIAEKVGGAIDNAGKFVQNTFGWTPGEANVSERLQQAAATPSNLGIMANLNALASGQKLPAASSPNVQKAVSTAKNVASNVKSAVQNTAQKASTAVKNVVSNVGNWLRSLWK